jgi:hypothetical protein
MLKLRYGWDSLTVARDIETFQTNSYRTQRETDIKFFQERIPTGKNARETRSRLETYVSDGVKNTVVFPEQIERIGCKRSSIEGMWQCKLRTTLITQSLGLDGVPARQVPMLFAADIVETYHTITTPYGLMVKEMVAVPLTEDEP